MRWFADNGHRVTGLDRSPEAVSAAAAYGETVLADIEGAPWPLMNGERTRQFDAVVVTNYLWRPLLPVIAQSLASGGLLIYETFAAGNETVGKPSRSDFLLQPAELLNAFQGMRVIAFEDGFLDNPPRFVQRIAAIQPGMDNGDAPTPKRYPL